MVIYYLIMRNAGSNLKQFVKMVRSLKIEVVNILTKTNIWTRS